MMIRNEFDVHSFMNLFFVCAEDVLFHFFLNNLQEMFRGASSFNRDLSSWDVSKATSVYVSSS